MLGEPIWLELSGALMEEPATNGASGRSLLVNIIKHGGGNDFGDFADVVNLVDDEILQFRDDELVSQNP